MSPLVPLLWYTDGINLTSLKLSCIHVEFKSPGQTRCSKAFLIRILIGGTPGGGTGVLCEAALRRSAAASTCSADNAAPALPRGVRAALAPAKPRGALSGDAGRDRLGAGAWYGGVDLLTRSSDRAAAACCHGGRRESCGRGVLALWEAPPRDLGSSLTSVARVVLSRLRLRRRAVSRVI